MVHRPTDISIAVCYRENYSRWSEPQHFTPSTSRNHTSSHSFIMDADINQAGGFMPSSILPSPSPSDTSSRIGAASQLPHPRPVALHPGSNKEETVRRYVEDKLLNISRRYVKKFGQPNPLDTVSGFTSFSEVCSELDGVVNILWLSGTRR